MKRARTILMITVPLLAVAIAGAFFMMRRSWMRGWEGSCRGNLKILRLAAVEYEDRFGVDPFTTVRDMDELFGLLEDSGIQHPDDTAYLTAPQYTYTLLPGAKGGPEGIERALLKCLDAKTGRTHILYWSGFVSREE